VTDLEERGLLDDTLVVWMGEFGRTPKFKGKGRDHYAKAWTTMFLGAGIRGGQIVGRTDAVGARVEERPVSVPDFMATICRLLGIDPAKETTLADGRPVKLVDQTPQPIAELLG
jgi:arylsulfatase A-like enzyme